MFPAWSPDGSRIAFMSTRDGNREIYVMNADGTQPQRLTVDDAGDDCPAWSPDGSLIAWDSDREGGAEHWEIYLMNADGSDQVRVTYTSAEATAINPDWMPQNHNYLGQEPPGLVPMRFPPDSLCANSEWFWHGAPMFSPDLRELHWSKYTIHPTYHRTELASVRLERNQWTPLQSPSFADLDYNENNPFFWAGSDTLYFRSDRPGGYIFRVARTEFGWSAPAPVPVPIPPGQSMGNQFALAGNRDMYLEFWDGPDADLYVSRFVGSSYQAPEPLMIANTANYEWGPYADPNGRFLLFASNRPGGYGMNDLYICVRGAGGIWEAPVNLGGVINGPDEDAFPCISPDGLYFFYQTLQAGDLGYNPYWVDAQIIYDLLPDETATALQQMTATYREDAIRIAWQMSALEAGVAFAIQRTEPPQQEYRTLPDLRIERDGLAFTATDASIEPGSAYRYRVEYEIAGRSRPLFETETIAIPAAPLALQQNVPNPFNPTTLIRYYLPEAGRVTLNIYDVSGRRIVCLIDGMQAQGPHDLTWNGRDQGDRLVPSGAYFYLLRTERATRTRRMILLR
jgi:hypothetical protein